MDIISQFREPDRKYSVLAFWFLSGKLEAEKLRWQIDEMVDKGVYGGFMHPRAYLETPYLEQEWWDAIGACVDEARKTGFSAWIYDEYAWPSGTAGSTFEYGFQKPSRTLAMGRENMAKGLYAKRFITEEEVKKDRNTDDCLIKIQRKDGIIYGFYCRTYEKAVDYLNPDTIKLFIQMTHEEYKKRFGDGFGKWIPGIFFDEIFMAGNPLPWTDRLPEVFLGRYGYDLMEELPCLVDGDGEHERRVRKDYFALAASMYEEAFFGQLSHWCQENQLRLTGHTEEFLWEHPRRQGNYFRTMRHLMIPGADCHDYRYRYPRKITFCEPKYAVSVARAYGKERAMSEALGGAGWNCTPQEMKRGVNTLAAMGINMFVLHGFYYECSHQGSQSDWPTSFFYQNPYWKYFKCFADYIRRISFMNSIGRPVVRYGLFYPIEWMSECMVNGEENQEGADGSRCFHTVLNCLLENQMDVDMIDGDCLLAAEIRDGKMCIGHQQFELLLLPSGAELEMELMEKLNSWKAVGGKLVIYETDSKMRQRENESILRPDACCSPKEAARAAAGLVAPDGKIVEGDPQEVYLSHRKDEENHYFFLCNSSREKRKLTLEFRQEALEKAPKAVKILDIETGISHGADWEKGEGKIRLFVELEAAEAVYLVFLERENVEGTSIRKQDGIWNEEWIAGRWEFLPMTADSQALFPIPLTGFTSDVRESCRQIWIHNQNKREEWDGCRKDRISLWDAFWITRRPSWNDQLDAGDLYFYKDFFVDRQVTDAEFCLAAIDAYEVYINGTLAAEGLSDGNPVIFHGGALLQEGINRIAVHVKNHHPIQEVHLCSAKALPKDRLISLLLQGQISTVKGMEMLVSDGTWFASDFWEKDWYLPAKAHPAVSFDVQNIRNFNKESADHGWIPAWERGQPPLLPWGDLPLFGKTAEYPVTLYYTVTIPSGSIQIEMPETEGETFCFLDGKPVVWNNGWKDIWRNDDKHMLTIQVRADSASCGLKRPVRVRMAPYRMNLTDWQLLGLSWYSGSCRYRNTFYAKPDGHRYQLDLGKVNFCPEVWVNGIPAGIRLWAPYKLDITGFLKEGENEIVVLVSNLAGNERRHMLVEEGQALGWNRYWNEDNMDRDSQNYVSGLLGPVRLLKEEHTAFEPVWYTVPEFSDREPLQMNHKENAEIHIPKETITNLHVLARAHIWTDSRRQRRILRITADDYYKLHVNGKFLSQGPAPAYPEHYYYNEIDLTPYLKEGDNIIGLHLYYQGLVNRVWNSGDRRFGVAAMVTEEPETVGAGQEEWQNLSWKYQVSKAYSGDTTGYETQFLENFDSNLWEEDWNQPDYDDAAWETMVPAVWADYSLSRQPVSALDCYKIRPEKIQKGENGWFIDIGQEITGSLCVKAEGMKGSRVIIRCGEELKEDGSVRCELRCNCTYEEVWTLNGRVCNLEPYDYKGFRYAELIPENGAKILDAEVLVRHYPMDPDACTLSCSDKNLEAVFEICKNGVKYGTQEAYLDCPTREKGQYLGDSVVTGNSQVWLTGSVEMLEKCITQFAFTRTTCPGLLGVAPGAFMQEVADFSLLWSQLLLQHYGFTGNLEFLKEMYPVAKGILEHFKQYAREDGLLERVADKWNLVDWPENLRDDYDFDLTRPVVASGCHNVINALYIGAAKTLDRIEQLIGQPRTFDWESLQDTYFRVFYRPENGLLADSEFSNHCALHSNLYALYFELVLKEKEQKIGDFLADRGFSCGVFTSYFILKGLARAGRYEDVYRLIVNRTEHGWVNMVREGATCCFEAWGKEQKWNTSLCHPWASAPVSVLIECIAGFCPEPECRDGYCFEPHIPEELEYFEMAIPFRGKKYVVRKQKGKTECRMVSL